MFLVLEHIAMRFARALHDVYSARICKHHATGRHARRTQSTRKAATNPSGHRLANAFQFSFVPNHERRFWAARSSRGIKAVNETVTGLMKLPFYQTGVR